MTFSAFLTISGLNKEGKMPMRRFLLAIIALSALCVTAEECAKSAAETKESAEAAQSTETSCGPQFYVGISAGYDRMISKRTEGLKAGTGTQLYFSNNKTQRTNAVSGKAIAGFLWTIPNTPFVLSPEMYIGHGSGQITLQESGHDPLGGPAEKSYQSSFKQSFSIEIILRAGFYLTENNNFLYVLGGVNRSKFENKFTLSSTDVGGVPVPALFTKKSKFLKSSVFGLGYERKIGNIKLGIDLRYTPYSAWRNYSKTVPVSDDKISLQFKPKIITTALTVCYLF